MFERSGDDLKSWRWNSMWKGPGNRKSGEGLPWLHRKKPGPADGEEGRGAEMDFIPGAQVFLFYVYHCFALHMPEGRKISWDCMVVSLHVGGVN